MEAFKKAILESQATRPVAMLVQIPDIKAAVSPWERKVVWKMYIEQDKLDGAQLESRVVINEISLTCCIYLIKLLWAIGNVLAFGNVSDIGISKIIQIINKISILSKLLSLRSLIWYCITLIVTNVIKINCNF